MSELPENDPRYQLHYEGALQAAHLMGVDLEFPILEKVRSGTIDIEKILPLSLEKQAFEHIDTSTNPKGIKINEKRGVALEVRDLVSNGALSEQILKELPVVYFGSGIDVEYPIVLGARHITLVDPILGVPEVRAELLKRIEKIVAGTPEIEVKEEGDTIIVSGNFGQGPETLTINLLSVVLDSEAVHSDEEVNHGGEVYQKAGVDVLPENIGAGIFFASHIPVSDKIYARMNKDGIILDGSVMISDIHGETQSVRQLGHHSDTKRDAYAKEFARRQLAWIQESESSDDDQEDVEKRERNSGFDDMPGEEF